MIRNLFAQVFLIVLMIPYDTIAYAQDPFFSQHYASSVYTNPAFAGTEGNSRIMLSGRIQFPEVSGSSQSSSFSYDQYVNPLHGGIGFLSTSDIYDGGFINRKTYGGIYSYHFDVNERITVKGGVEGTFIHKQLDFSNLVFGDAIDPRYGFPYIKQTVLEEYVYLFDLAAGVLVYSDKVYSGFSIHHIAEPNESYIKESVIRLPRLYTVHAGLILGGKSERSVSFYPDFICQKQQNLFYCKAGSSFKYRKLTCGLRFHITSTGSSNYYNATSYLIGIQSRIFRITYSFDSFVTRFTPLSAHELSLSFHFNYKNKKIHALNIPF